MHVSIDQEENGQLSFIFSCLLPHHHDVVAGDMGDLFIPDNAQVGSEEDDERCPFVNVKPVLKRFYGYQRGLSDHRPSGPTDSFGCTGNHAITIEFLPGALCHLPVKYSAQWKAGKRSMK